MIDCRRFRFLSIVIDAHGLKIQGRGYLIFFTKIPRGVKAFRKNCLGGSPYFGFYCIFINKCFEICLRGVLYLPSPLPSPHLTHLCASMSIVCKREIIESHSAFLYQNHPEKKKIFLNDCLQSCCQH